MEHRANAKHHTLLMVLLLMFILRFAYGNHLQITHRAHVNHLPHTHTPITFHSPSDHFPITFMDKLKSARKYKYIGQGDTHNSSKRPLHYKNVVWRPPARDIQFTNLKRGQRSLIHLYIRYYSNQLSSTLLFSVIIKQVFCLSIQYQIFNKSPVNLKT